MRQVMRSRANCSRISTALVLSYAFDWTLIIATAALGALFARLPPNKRPFSLTNAEISFPFVTHEKIPTWSLGIIACVGPAARAVSEEFPVQATAVSCCGITDMNNTII